MRLPSVPRRALLALIACAPFAAAQGVPVPYIESFESPTWPGPEWVITYSAPAFGRIQTLIPSPVSSDGGRAANFDVSTGNNFSTNWLTVSVNLAASPTAILRYLAKETADETDPDDGLFINDGVSPTFVKVVDHATLTASWTEITVNLASQATANGLSITSNFKVRFSQRDNNLTPTDGLQIDGVRISNPPTGQPNSAQAFLDINSGVNGAGQPSTIGNNGPFLTSAAVGVLLTFTVQGMPNQPYILAAGPVNDNNAFFPGIGSLDIGLLGPVNLGDVQIVLDGTAPGALNALAKTNPAGLSVLSASVPALPSGPWIAFQVAIFNGPILTLTAATQVMVP